jgi:hypothetical protein
MEPLRTRAGGIAWRERRRNHRALLALFFAFDFFQQLGA